MAIDWNEPRLVLAVKRAGDLYGAAKALGVNHSTVFRHLNALEEKVGARLFERLPGGAYQPTAAGERMALAAERIEEETHALDREISGGDLRLSGRLCLTSSETLAHGLLLRLLAEFRKSHPGVVIEHAVSNRLFDLSRREADVAIRPTRPSQPNLWGRRLAEVAWAVYGSCDALAAEPVRGSGEAGLRGRPVIGWEETARRFGGADWLERTAMGEVVYRTASLMNQLAAAKAGIGLAVLPCYLGDAEPQLARARPGPIPELADELWIVTHAELRSMARIRALFDVVATGLIAERELIEGRRPTG